MKMRGRRRLGDSKLKLTRGATALLLQSQKLKLTLPECRCHR